MLHVVWPADLQFKYHLGVCDELDTVAKESSCAVSPLSHTHLIASSSDLTSCRRFYSLSLGCERLWRPFGLSFFPLFGSLQTLMSSVCCKCRVYRYFDLLFSAVGSVTFLCYVLFTEWLNLVLIPLISHAR